MLGKDISSEDQGKFLSKMVHFAPCWNDTGAQEVALIFTRDIFAKHGIPQEVVTDRGTQFTSHFWSSVAKMLGVKQCLSSARRPQTDRQTERTNRTLEDMLRHFVPGVDQRQRFRHFLTLSPSSDSHL